MAVKPRFSPAFAVVEGKLHPPGARPGTVSRRRLVQQLEAAPRTPVVSLIAAAGYGKTLLLAEWIATAGRPAAWLTLDRLDNDPTTFLSYVAVALDRVEPVDAAIRSALAVPGERILATAVPRLATALQRWDPPGILVLDDVHRLEDRGCLDALSLLLHHLPPGCQVAIAARWEPDLPFGRLRAQRELLELGPAELAFDEHETLALTETVGDRLTPAEARGLAERTQGWAAGIYLAALAHRSGHPGSQSIDAVSGRDEYIAEYLRAGFRADVTDDDVTLLARTSILERVEPDVADVLVGAPGTGARLHELAHRQPFIGELPGPPVSYRYHHLLRSFLEAELERREPGAVAGLHAMAGDWYASEGRMDLAIEHRLASGDLDAAARLATAVALPTFYGGRSSTLDRWIRALDEATLAAHPPLAVIAGWVHLLQGRSEACDRMADIVERTSWDEPPGDGAASFESSRAMLRAIMGRRGLADMLANAELAAATEPPDSPWRANALWLLGSARLLHGDVAAADAIFAAAVEAGALAGATAMVAAAKRAGIAMARGDWPAADRLARESLAVLEQANLGGILAALSVYAVSARVAAQLGDLARAREAIGHAQLVRPLASHVAPWYSVDALLELARAHLAMSDPAGARSVIREAEDIARRRSDIGILRGELEDIRLRVADASSTLVGSSALTAAELRLLPILSTYLSFQEIADRLHVSRNTIKTQALSIYGKLQASSRSEAVERAVELGLLEPFPGLELARGGRAD
jgi:LuxR family transcriptional regulator, maltose regulon positive regulatory protein